VPARAGVSGSGKRAVRSDAFHKLVAAVRSPTAPTVSDLVNGLAKLTKIRASSAPVRNLCRGESEGVACEYALGSFDEFDDIRRRPERLTFSGVKDLFDRGKIGTKYGPIQNNLCGSKTADGTVVLAPGSVILQVSRALSHPLPIPTGARARV
jgi:hypothetical protein